MIGFGSMIGAGLGAIGKAASAPPSMATSKGGNITTAGSVFNFGPNSRSSGAPSASATVPTSNAVGPMPNGGAPAGAFGSTLAAGLSPNVLILAGAGLVAVIAIKKIK